MNIRKDQMTHGYKPKNFLDNPFLRWHSSIEDNPHHQDDIDDHSLYETDNFERMKKF